MNQTATKPTRQDINSFEPDELVKALFSFANVKARPMSLYYVDDDGVLRFRFHKYQAQAMETRRRFILLLGGTQSGKTSFGPIWLHREICIRGAGDYLAVAPTYPLMKKKMLPEFLRYFEETLRLGTYNKADKIFVVSEAGEISLFGKKQDEPTKIYFGYATDPDSLESATAKGAWLDECGQKKFKLPSFDAIMRRLSLNIGRVLMTTTPYYLGWLKRQFYDLRNTAKAAIESVAVIRFPSIANPSFPKEEYERAKRVLPEWKFNMFYRALFTRPVGMIYDCFKEAVHKVAAFEVPSEWRRFVGVDFGGVNTAAVKIAQDPRSGNYYAYTEYHKGEETSKTHAQNIRGNDGRLSAYGGAPSEGQWRREMRSGGLNVQRPPIHEVEVGIDRVYSLLKEQKLFIFDSCNELLDEFASYSRVLNEDGRPTEKIENKNDYHLLDALRYVCSALKSGTGLQVGRNPLAGHRG